MLATVATVLATQDLSKGVIVSVILSGVFFAGKVAKLFRVTPMVSDDAQSTTYVIEGQIFYASTEAFISAFDFYEPVKNVTIDVSRAHLWDISSVGALDKIVMKYRRAGVLVTVVGLNEASATMIDRFAIHDKHSAATAKIAAH